MRLRTPHGNGVVWDSDLGGGRGRRPSPLPTKTSESGQKETSWCGGRYWMTLNHVASTRLVNLGSLLIFVAVILSVDIRWLIALRLFSFWPSRRQTSSPGSLGGGYGGDYSRGGGSCVIWAHSARYPSSRLVGRGSCHNFGGDSWDSLVVAWVCTLSRLLACGGVCLLFGVLRVEVVWSRLLRRTSVRQVPDRTVSRSGVQLNWPRHLLKGHLMLQDNYGLYTDIESTC